ncbi:modified peptide precursor CbpA [Varunaivibrio sulfuroxidans]|uniref:Modified peptide CbpA n=1 Tax=Varunaivibrio sulfuroxidans TaxID=1773489 RepID=A0A4R3J835_9PROT|nr:modified peptide precursor CbpA [Varunaivibrio sulfuroxidans]TCS62119.1 modified peptide precursor CbpA [Varunaivibrio sulfuroxidans]WES30552.1 modified peptide precursor CbpA [Varunaivibrio sulfuroxidans]
MRNTSTSVSTTPTRENSAVDDPAADVRDETQGAPLISPLIARRKSCDADGTGLSHYILMDRQVPQ